MVKNKCKLDLSNTYFKSVIFKKIDSYFFMASNDSFLSFIHSNLQTDKNVFYINNTSKILVYKSKFNACRFKRSPNNQGGILLLLNSNSYGDLNGIEIFCMYNTKYKVNQNDI